MEATELRHQQRIETTSREADRNISVSVAEDYSNRGGKLSQPLGAGIIEN